MRKLPSVGTFLVMMLLTVPLGAQQRDKDPNVRSQPAGAPPAGGKSLERPRPATEDVNYVIGPEDVLDISVWKEQDFSRTVPVRPDGRISLPLLNDIQAAGLTPTQLAGSITALLRKFVTQPQVTVIVTAINSRRAYIVGEVNRPGPIPLLPSMTVLQALATAGGFTQFANPKKIYVMRTEGGKLNRYPFNYKEALRGDMRQDVVLKPGDTIVVP